MFPLAVAGLVGSMMLAVVVAVAWVALGGGSDAPALASAAEEVDPGTMPGPLASARAPGSENLTGTAPQQPSADAIDVGDADAAPASAGEPAGGSALAGGAAGQPEATAPRRSVVTRIADRRPAPPRPRAPADTTAAGHAGLAEALLAAGDTTGAIAAYNAFLARNSDPSDERAVIAILRQLGGSGRY